MSYGFPQIYGSSPQGNDLFNAISEDQKQRAREVLELYSRFIGVQFVEMDADATGVDLNIATGDPRALDPTLPPTSVGGIAGGGVAIMNAFLSWGESEYGGGWFTTAMHEIGHLLGLGHAYDLPNLTIQGGAGTNPAENVFPGDHDILHAQTLHRPDGRDIDLYQFNVSANGVFRAETVAERLASANLLNTVLTLYRDVSGGREVVARNDDYYSNDSYLEVPLTPGTYYVAVTSVGNTEIDPTVADSGFGGRTQGTYNLKLEFTPTIATTSLADASNVRFDGDADGVQGGTYQFWFQSGGASGTIFVDKANVNSGAGTLANPFNNLPDAINAAATGPAKIIRVVGNAGADNTLNNPLDAKPYLVGFKDQDPILDEPLADGGFLLVPQNVTLMIDAGAVFKLRKANINAGTLPQGVDASGSAIQVLGTPATPVWFTSYRDDTIGGDSDGAGAGSGRGDWGGIVFREDSDREASGVYLNYVNHGQLTYGGGRVFVNSDEDTYNPVHLIGARPSLSYNTVQFERRRGVFGQPEQLRRRRPPTGDSLRPAADRPGHARQHAHGQHPERRCSSAFPPTPATRSNSSTGPPAGTTPTSSTWSPRTWKSPALRLAAPPRAPIGPSPR